MDFEIGKKRLESLIIKYLEKNYLPDYGWAENSYYKEYTEKWGYVDFPIDDFSEYWYILDPKKTIYFVFDNDRKKIKHPKSLIISTRISKDLNTMFGSFWVDVFRDWFEKNTGLEVETIIRTIDENNE